MNLSISDILEQAWQLTRKHGLTLAVVFFVFYLIAGGVSMAFMPSDYWDAIASGSAMTEPARSYNMGDLLVYVCSYIFNIGIFTTMLRLARGSQENFNLRSFQLPLSTYGKNVVYNIIYGICICIGFLFLIIPGLIVAVRFGFGGIYLLDHPEASLEDAARFSWQSTSGQFFPLLGLGIVSALVVLTGLILCCVGICYTAVIGDFAFVLTYLYLLNPQPMRNMGATPYDQTRY